MHLKNMLSTSLLTIILLMNMLLPYRLLSSELSQNDCLISYLQYRKSLEKVEKNLQRAKFLSSCYNADIIPRFLRFRIPNNGTFDQKSVFEFQKSLLRKEIVRAKSDRKAINGTLCERRERIKNDVPEYLLPSVAFHSRQSVRSVRSEVRNRHNKKLLELSEQQERPLFTVQNTVILHNLDEVPPNYVTETH